MIWPFKTTKSPDILIRELESDDTTLRETAFKDLIDHSDPDTDRLVLGALEAFDSSPKELILPLIDIAGQRQINEALPIFKLLMGNSDSQIRESTLQALVATQSQDSLDILISFLSSSDATIKQKVRTIIIENFGADSLGALVRAVPEDNESPLYFEIVSLMEDLDLFELLKENFNHPDINVREFHFNTLVKFHRPDFVPLYLELYDETSSEIKSKIEKVLSDFSVQELIPPFQMALGKGSPTSDSIFKLSELLIFSHFSESREQILDLAIKISEPRFRLKILPSLIKKLDPFTFEKGLELLKDPVAEIRTHAQNSLSLLVKMTYKRMKDKDEPNKIALSKLYDGWEKKLTDWIKSSDGAPDFKKGVRRLFFSLAQNRHDLLKPHFGDFISSNFNETYHFIKDWDFNEQFELFSWLVTTDPAYGSLLLSVLQGNPDENFWRILLKLIAFLDQEDRTAFKKRFLARNRNISLETFLKDPDPSVRVSALEFASELKVNGLVDLLKTSTKDPSPQVRLGAIKNLVKHNYPQVEKILSEATSDPDESVAFYALKELKEIIPTNRMAPHLVKFLNSSSDPIRNFALQQIAQITKDRYKSNFNNLAPNIRKLAAKVIQKIDSGFSDSIISELNSLDPQTRLKAALLLENVTVDSKGREALLAAMKDPSKLVRAAVIKTLGVIGDNSLIKHLVEFFNDPDPRVRANTIEAVSSLGDRQAIQVLLPFLQDPNNRIRANAIVGINRIGGFNLTPVLQSMLKDTNINMIASAIWAIGQMKDPNHLNFLYPFLNNKNEMLRYNTIRSISEINPDLLKAYFPTFRKDPSSKIRKLIASISHKVL